MPSAVRSESQRISTPTSTRARFERGNPGARADGPGAFFLLRSGTDTLRLIHFDADLAARLRAGQVEFSIGCYLLEWVLKRVLESVRRGPT